MPRTSRDKFFSAVNESYDALLSAVEATNARGYRASRTVLKEARKGERELVGLARKWTGAPTKFFDLFEAVLDVQARGQQRTLELTRDVVGGVRESGREVREATRGVVEGNRAAGEAVVEGLRGAYSRTVERFRGAEEAEPVAARPAVVRASARPKPAVRKPTPPRRPALVRPVRPPASAGP